MTFENSRSARTRWFDYAPLLVCVAILGCADPSAENTPLTIFEQLSKEDAAKNSAFLAHKREILDWQQRVFSGQTTNAFCTIGIGALSMITTNDIIALLGEPDEVTHDWLDIMTKKDGEPVIGRTHWFGRVGFVYFGPVSKAIELRVRDVTPNRTGALPGHTVDVSKVLLCEVKYSKSSPLFTREGVLVSGLLYEENFNNIEDPIQYVRIPLVETAGVKCRLRFAVGLQLVRINSGPKHVDMNQPLVLQTLPNVMLYPGSRYRFRGVLASSARISFPLSDETLYVTYAELVEKRAASSSGIHGLYTGEREWLVPTEVFSPEIQRKLPFPVRVVK